MSGRILILDSIATHRIVLKVKLAAAQYIVETCATCAEAEAQIAQKRPDLVLVNLSDPFEDRHAFCTKLRNNTTGSRVAIIGVCVADTARARFTALDAGVDDVLPHQVSDALMQARIRSLLRRRNVGLEWQMRDETSRALGFDEERTDFVQPARVTVVAENPECGTNLVTMLQDTLNFRVNMTCLQNGAVPQGDNRKADLFVIEATLANRSKSALFQLISDIHARDDTREAAKMVVLAKGQQHTAAMLLDLGADDVVFADVSQEEIAIRARALIAHKEQQDRLRDRVRNGLRAAVIDPLTGLYNRRYAEAHLRRIAEQAHASGRSYAMMVVDIDHFKAINDTHGHAVGDLVLKELADRVRTNFRAIDLLARIGGEEFLIAMPNTTTEQAHLAAERMRCLISETPFKSSKSKRDLRVSVSVGVAVDGLESISQTSSDSLFNRADKALYQSKAMGRNMVSISENAA